MKSNKISLQTIGAFIGALCGIVIGRLIGAEVTWGETAGKEAVALWMLVLAGVGIGAVFGLVLSHEKKGQKIGLLIGGLIGLGVSYAIWGPSMWDWAVPSVIPVMFGSTIGAFIGHAVFDRPANREPTAQKQFKGPMGNGGKGMLLGAGIGVFIGGIAAALLWFVSNQGFSFLYPSVLLVFPAIFGLVGFLGSASPDFISVPIRERQKKDRSGL
jgi:hypothetical protein